MTRKKWLDIAKGIAMILIVLGHTLRTGALRNIVYAFHVPCFFSLAGITAKETLSLNKILKDFKRLLVPYYTFGLISIAIFAVIGAFAVSRMGVRTYTSVSSNLFNLAIGANNLPFNAPLWFLPCLFIMRLWYSLLYKLCRGGKPALSFLALLGCVLSFFYSKRNLPELPFSFDLMLKLFPFFWVGKLLSGMIISRAASVKRLNFLGAGAILLLLTSISALISPPVNYTSQSFTKPFLFYGNAFLGCFGLICLSAGLKSAPLLEQIGTNTLSILVLHKFPIVFFQIIPSLQNLLQAPYSVITILFIAIPIVAISIALSLFAGSIIKRISPFFLGESH